jgi:hypothetical protein
MDVGRISSSKYVYLSVSPLRDLLSTTQHHSSLELRFHSLIALNGFVDSDDAVLVLVVPLFSLTSVHFASNGRYTKKELWHLLFKPLNPYRVISGHPHIL